jgi:hypothetical protein
VRYIALSLAFYKFACGLQFMFGNAIFLRMTLSVERPLFSTVAMFDLNTKVIIARSDISRVTAVIVPTAPHPENIDPVSAINVTFSQSLMLVKRIYLSMLYRWSLHVTPRALALGRGIFS